MSDTAPPRPTSLPDIGREMAADLAQLQTEIAEVDLLIAQAKTEAVRHESRRVAASEKAAATASAAAAATPEKEPSPGTDPSAQLVVLTKRAALMESQVDVLEGKRRALARYRDALVGYEAAVSASNEESLALPGPIGAARAKATRQPDPGGPPPAVSRLLLSSQEDLRREIARAMHDGPAQNLTNIVLQAQIVERLVERDPASASEEVRRLVAMVQQTLEATKTFIFDVRPMVLDDLGLVPTLRRAARERGRRAGVAVGFDSLGVDRRLPMDLESGLFRMIDEAMSAYLSVRADNVSVRLDWSDQIEARVSATRSVAEMAPDATPDAAADADLPPALAAMMEDRRADARNAAAAARRDAIVVLPPSTWREISGRAETLGLIADLSADGAEVHLVLDVPVQAPPGLPSEDAETAES
jgi:two-component system sensor histidine kinase DegS